jgi:FK506-binding protein 6
LNGATFSFNNEENNQEYIDDGSSLTFEDYPDAENYLNLFKKTFDELKREDMQETRYVGVWKKVIQPAKANAKAVDFASQRIKYHRNIYLDGLDYPIDSTNLLSKPGVILPDTDMKPIGFFEAMKTMKEGEKSCFIISYEKMFGEVGCPPRIPEKSDILAEIVILKIDDIGDQELIDILEKNSEKLKKFKDLKASFEESRMRAKDYFKSHDGLNKAVKMYKKILETLNFCDLESEDDKKDSIELKIMILTNLVICHIKKDKPHDALKFIAQIESLVDINQNAKILFNKAKANRMIGELDIAKICLKRAYFMNQSDDILKEMDILEKCISNDKEFNKNLATKLI